MSEHDKNLPQEGHDPNGSGQPASDDEQSATTPENLDDIFQKLIADGKIGDLTDTESLLAEAEAAAAAEAQKNDSGKAETGDVSEEETKLAAEYLGDLKRLQAEYQNYRKRVDRDRETDKVIALVNTLRELVPILDDLDRVEAAGDLEGSPLEAIAKKFRSTLEKMGLTSFGKVGDVFDPNFHEAVFKNEVDGVTEETVFDVVEVGYMVGDRELRPAKVAVQVPKA